MAKLPFEMSLPQAPTFPERTFDIRNFGAQGDGTTLNTAAFNKAIDACRQAGGGVVLIPPGDWLTGPIRLGSRVNLHLQKGALVRFSSRFSDYRPVVFTRWEGVECYNYSPLLYGSDGEDMAVTGEGMFDGQGQAWWGWKNLQQAAAKSLYDAEFERIPVEQRIFGAEEAALRPQFLQFIRCRNVLVEGVTFINGPMWTIHPVYCENVLIRRVTINSEGPNTDGVNPDSCRNVLIDDCSFATGDDCVAINAGMNEDGWRVGRPCENIVIQNCRMREGHGAVSIGSGMSGGVRRVCVRNCEITGGEFGLRIKSMPGRGGFVEQVYAENLRMSNLRRDAILLTMFYEASTAPSRSDAPPVFRDIHLKNITCYSAAAAVTMRGLPETPIVGVTLKNLQMRAVKGISCENVDGLTLQNVRGAAAEKPLLACTNVSRLRVLSTDLKLQG